MAALAPIFWISGPPASGKSTLSDALLRRFSAGFHLEVDRIRTMALQGLADSVPWTDETERQFQIAEITACDISKRYQDAGFAVAVDHCRNLPTLERVISANLQMRPVIKICLMPDLETNLDRNKRRTNKPFGPEVLVDTIRYTNRNYRNSVPTGWHVIDNSSLNVDETVELILRLRAQVDSIEGM